MYANVNFELGPCLESPCSPDTLILFKDGTFVSDFYGKGIYTFKGLSIELDPFDKTTANLNTRFTNRLFEEPRIILDYDKEQAYRKF